MSRHVLALDQGTSSSRSIVFDETGRIVALAQREFRQHYPQPGWVEHDPEEIWQSQLATAREAIARAGLTAHDIAAIGITNQRETTVVWNRRTGQPVCNAIVWQDRRGEPLCARLRADGLEETVRRSTGLVIDPYFSATKIRWILDHVNGAHLAAAQGELAFGTVDSWLIWNLTGGRVHATDVSNASRTMLYDIRHDTWDHELLAALHVPDSVLPQVLPSSHAFGETDAGLFGAPIPIAGVAGDQQAALFGQACFEPGLAKNTYGTGCFMLMHTGERFERSANGLVSTAAARTGTAREYAMEGSVFIGGAVVQWLRDGLQAIRASGEVQALAESVPDAGGVMFVPAFTGLGAPYWNADARGTIVGLTRGSTVAHIARAALESIAFQSAALLQAMARDAAAQPGGRPLTELRVDGGACVNDLLMQFQADLLGIPVLRPQVTETTALGAAYLAGLGVGIWRDRAELAALWQAERRFLPTMARDRAAELMARWERAVRQTVAE
ncbi:MULTISPECIES: glycerol kinase GlpK [unclassified Rubrivivax]|uniref:glycerol kinase GlpK n=1 Tax=unclassified Rubrivivax TaxID=2649762 RepID=UPI001E3A158A|nr:MULTISPECIES: glycerol kinase GlpK [unclassified Rubrivivax]MCC9596883.1 glycerol kinase GlpK [Rubrivivax sp. JA1055]MCC9649039.1 glycerol kinase GlpK [Rubrivivax sp. JA1029]